MSIREALGDRERFNLVIERVLSIEGGYVNHPEDPGGETKYGISKRSYPSVDIKNLTREAAAEIYYRDFWPFCRGHKLVMLYQLFDSAINHGQGNTIRILQRALKVADDGHWGPMSKAAYEARSEEDTVLLFLASRLRFFTKLSKFKDFGAGWSNRIAELLVIASEDNDD